MGDKMDKSDVIWQNKMNLKVDWAAVKKLVKFTGLDIPSANLAKGKDLIAKYSPRQDLKKPYVKVGATKKDLLIRVKDNSKPVSLEDDVVLIKDYVRKRAEIGKSVAQAEKALESAVAGWEKSLIAEKERFDEAAKTIKLRADAVRKDPTAVAQGELISIKGGCMTGPKMIRIMQGGAMKFGALVRSTAAAEGVAPKALDIAALQLRVQGLLADSKGLIGNFEELDEALDELTAEWAEGQKAVKIESEKKQADLASLTRSYKDVLTSVKSFEGRAGGLAGTIRGLAHAKIDELGDAKAVLTKMMSAFHDLETTQKELREEVAKVRVPGQQPYDAMAASSLTDQEKIKFITPLSSKIFAANAKIVNQLETCKELLLDLNEGLRKKHEDDEDFEKYLDNFEGLVK